MIRQFPTKAEWLAERRFGISSTDCPAILGLSPWASPLSVYASKVVETEIRSEPEDDADEGLVDRLEFGLAFQRPIAELWARRAKATLLSLSDGFAEALIIDDQFPWLRSSIDFIASTPNGRALVEVKNVDVSKAREWDNGRAPAYYEAQLQHELLVAQSLAEPPEFGILVACVGGNRLEVRERDIDDEFLTAWFDEAKSFWDRVQARTPPKADGHAATRAALLALDRVKGKSVKLPGECLPWVEEKQELSARMTEDKKRVKALDSLILEAMGDAEVGELPDGRVIHMSEVKRKEYTVAATSYRQIRVGSAKS